MILRKLLSLLIKNVKNGRKLTQKEKEFQIKVSFNVEMETKESNQCKSIKYRVESLFDSWKKMVDVDSFKGEKLKIYFGVKLSDGNEFEKWGPRFINKTSEEFIKFKDSCVKLILDNINNEYNDESTIDIELLIVGELKRDPQLELVDYQFFNQSYVGTNGKGQLGSHSKEFEEDFIDLTKNLKLINIQDQLWSEDGSFIC
ncbi:MAG: hypothetical protein H0T62_08300 [Parachlamydiaceae bacterium]|nr:hypothetical protein [Parachlamydiaceae bacterium]